MQSLFKLQYYKKLAEREEGYELAKSILLIGAKSVEKGSNSQEVLDLVKIFFQKSDDYVSNEQLMTSKEKNEFKTSFKNLKKMNGFVSPLISQMGLTGIGDISEDSQEELSSCESDSEDEYRLNSNKKPSDFRNYLKNSSDKDFYGSQLDEFPSDKPNATGITLHSLVQGNYNKSIPNDKIKNAPTPTANQSFKK